MVIKISIISLNGHEYLKTLKLEAIITGLFSLSKTASDRWEEELGWGGGRI